MTEPSATPSPDAQPLSPTQADALWVQRTGTRTYTGYNTRGASVAMGPASEGAVFTPGELLKIALAGCAGMSSDASFARRLGDDYRVTIHVQGAAHATQDRYEQFTEQFEVDLSGLDNAEQERLLTVVQRSIDSTCTVGLTLRNGAEVRTTFTE
jgi:uncharacterized OsmC-like protein